MNRDSWVRRLLIGRPHGMRAWLRRETGVMTWLDEPSSPAGSLREEGARSSASEPQVPPPPSASSDPAAQADAPDSRWVRVLDASEVAPGELAEVFVEGRALVVANVEGTLHAVDSVCPHAGGPLADGELDGTTLTCPWHGWSYDVSSGASLVSDAVCLHRFPVRLDGGGIYVEV